MTSWFSALGGEVDMYKGEIEASASTGECGAPASRCVHVAKCNIGLAFFCGWGGV